MKENERGSAIVIVLMCIVILTVFLTVALRSVYELHKNNVKELKQVRHSASRLPVP